MKNLRHCDVYIKYTNFKTYCSPVLNLQSPGTVGTVKPYRQITSGWKPRLLLPSNRKHLLSHKNFSRVPYCNGTELYNPLEQFEQETALIEGLRSGASTHTGQLTTVYNSSSRDLIISSSLCGHLHTCKNLNNLYKIRQNFIHQSSSTKAQNKEKLLRTFVISPNYI